MGTRTTVFAAGLCLVIGVQLATAAATEKIESHVSPPRVEILSDEPPVARYRGEVESKKERCVVGRNVILVHDSKPPFTIGEDRTSSLGRYDITGPLPPAGDRIITNLQVRDISSSKRNRVCLADRKVSRSPSSEDDD